MESMETQIATLLSSVHVNDDYKSLSVPKDARSFAILEQDCLDNGIIKPLIIDEKDDIVDGMSRYAIAEKHKLPFTVSRTYFASEEKKRQWICAQSMYQKSYTKIQQNLARHRMMSMEDGTIDERAEKLAKRFQEAGVKHQTTVDRYKTCWFYGQKLLGGELISGIYDFAWGGGSVLLRDLNRLSNLTKTEQRRALSVRLETSEPWKQCIRAAKGESVSDSRSSLLEDVIAAKKALGSLNRHYRELRASQDRKDQYAIQDLSENGFGDLLPRVYKLAEQSREEVEVSSASRSLILKGLRLIKQERYAMLWSTILEYRAETKSFARRKRKRVKKHLEDLDECFVDHPPFDGNEMRRFQNKLESMGLPPTFRTVVEQTERCIKTVLQTEQIGPEARRLINDIRDDDSYWSKLLKKERSGVLVP